MSIREIAALTGLSITTVSHAINGTRAVSVKSKSLVDEAILKVGYKPSLAARMLKTNKSKIIALIIPTTEPDNSTNCFFFDVLNGAREVLVENGYDMMVSTYSELESERHLTDLLLLQKRLVDGILLVPFDRDPKSIDGLMSLELPVVLLDRHMDNCTLPAVYSDNFEGSRNAVKLLAESGAKKIAFAGGRMCLSSSCDRYHGYCAAMNELSLPIDEALVLTDLAFTPQNGIETAKKLLAEGAEAIFCANNVILMGIMQHLKASDQHTALIGFDDYDWMRLTTPPVTATYQNPHLIGTNAAALLLKIINGEPLSSQKVILPCVLHIRESHKL